MTTYAYVAKDGPDRTVSGEVSGRTREEAISRIDEMGYSPVRVEEKSGEVRHAHRPLLRRARPRDVTVFTEQLAGLVRSGVPILRALSTVSEQTENPAFTAIVRDIAARIRDGSLLSEAIARHPRLFGDLYANMVKAGEAGGVLDTILDRLAAAREKEEDLRRKVQSALAYPTLVLCVGLATIFVLLAFFLPRVVRLFANYQALPLPTRLLIAVSDVCSAYWYWPVLILLLGAAVVRRLAELENGRCLIDRMKLAIPFVGRCILESESARFARTLSLLVQAGVPIDRALALGSGALKNAVLRAEVDGIRRETIQLGVPISSGLKKSGFFPPYVANMTAVGEESGRLEQSLLEVAGFFEKSVDQRSRMATSILEPVLILAVGGVVGLIVAAMLLPIFELGGALR